MRSSDVQFAEIMNRSKAVKEQRLLKKKITIDGIVIALLVVLLVVVSRTIPMLKDTTTEVAEQHYGSLYLVTPNLGYVMIGLVAFVLGICVTILCMHLKKWKKEVH